MLPMKRETAVMDRADVAVVGAGPAGLMAAIAAAGRGCRVVVLEQLGRPGAKLLASGGGRCNLTNTLPPDEFMARFGRRGRFMQPALAALSAHGLRRFLDVLGVPTHAPDGVHVYPASEKAATVQAALLRRARQLGVAVRCGVGVTGLWLGGATGTVPFPQRREKGTVPTLRGVETDGGGVTAPRVVLATGGNGYPLLGGTGSGYVLARQAGHTIIEPTPALVPLVAREAWVRRCAGIALAPARVWIDLPGQSHAGITGDVLFTHAGLSGPAVLDLSGDVAALLRQHKTVPLRLDLAPGTSAEAWLARFDRWQGARRDPARQLAVLGAPAGQGGAKTMHTRLAEYLPKRVAATLCALAGMNRATQPAQATRAARQTLAGLLTALPLTVTGTEGWDAAMVTRGGVSLKEVDPRTLESKRLRGLFFAGEVLDLDGPSGGFNLQWAFSSGWLAGLSCADRG
jgi:hypothetical protein